jgi:hypothetical protein
VLTLSANWQCHIIPRFVALESLFLTAVLRALAIKFEVFENQLTAIAFKTSVIIFNDY